MKYKIINFDEEKGEKGHLTIQFPDIKLTKTLDVQGVPVHDKEEFQKWVDNYVNAYQMGKESEDQNKKSLKDSIRNLKTI